jgi:hypothetical protein
MTLKNLCNTKQTLLHLIHNANLRKTNDKPFNAIYDCEKIVQNVRESTTQINQTIENKKKCSTNRIHQPLINNDLTSHQESEKA